MAEARQSLLKNSSSIETIQDSLNSFGKSLRKANSTSSTIITSLYGGNRDKKNAIAKQTALFQKRRDAVRRREQEDIIESGKVGSTFKRTERIISGSTKGILGRIMDFVGTIMVGWALNNLPTIIKNSEDLIDRMSGLVSVLRSWFNGMSSFLSDFTDILGRVLRNITGIDFTSYEKEADRSKTELDSGITDVTSDMNEMIDSLIEFDLVKILGLEVDLGLSPEFPSPKLEGEMAPDDSGTPSSSGGGGNLKPLLDMISSGESPGAEYTAMFPSESYPQILGMTINEVIAFQKEKRKDGRISAAIGRYQMLYPEDFAKAAGIPLTAKFSPENQDKMVIAYLKKYRKLDLWLQGKISDAAFSEELAREFGTFKSASGYVLPNNTGSIGFEQMKPVFKKIKQGKTQPSRQTQTTGPAPRIDTSKRYKVGEDVSSTLGASARITSLKGSREYFRSRPHGGIDIACDPNLYISLRVDAEVVGTRSGGGYGNVIDVWIPSLGIQLRFAHNTRILISSGKIPAGTSFATTGYTGNVRPKGPDGSHIHLEADSRRGGTTYGGSTSPAPYVSLIRLTRSKIEGVRSKSPKISSAPTRAEVTAPEKRTDVAKRVKQERRKRTIPIPIPFNTNINPTQPPPQGGMGGPSFSLSEEGQLNSFIRQTFLLGLENS